MAAPLTIGLFGPMRVLVGDQPLPPVRSRKALWLLALLTLRHGRPVAREWLASTLWPDTDLSVAFTNLRPVIWELRRALGDQAYRLQSPDRVTVILDLEGADVDLAAFDTAIRQGDPEAFERALSLYRGPLLEGCPEEWTPQERGAREQDCIHALQNLAEGAEAEGDHARAIDYYQRLISFDPWRDAPRRGVMTALAKSGDVNAALQVYRSFANTLRSEANLTPDEQTTALYTRLRAQSRSRNVSQPTPVKTSEPAEAKISGYLPHALTSLFGRDDERMEVSILLRQRRLVTLLGPGGIGKTRLAMSIAKETAGEYSGGVWLVSLENLSEGSLVPGQVAAVLGIREEAASDVMKSIIQRLRRESLLLVLDNCEHLLDAVIPFCARLLGECGDVRILATSRESLGIMGERIYPVPALAVPDPTGLPQGQATRLRVLQSYEGVQLFVDRAQAVSAAFVLTGENAGSIAQICARLEGVPLAIELAAARVKAMTVDQIAERLDDHLRLLSGGNRSAAGRQQTLRATLDWSFALLSSQERTLLQRLSVFAGGWTLEAAEWVASGEGIDKSEVAELQSALTGKSIVGFDERTARFHLLETVRQYAAEKLAAAGETEVAMARHREWALGLAQQAEASFKGPQQGQWLDRLDSERPNLRSALATCDADPRVGLLLAGTLWRFWYIRGPHSEGSEQLQLVLERPCEDEVALAKAWYGRGCLAYSRTDQPLARRCILEALGLQRRLGNPLGVAEALNVLGNIEASLSNNSLARSYYEASLEIRRELGHKPDLALILYNLGAFMMPNCDYEAAHYYLKESLRLYEELGDECGSAWCLVVLGWVCEYQGEYGIARGYAEDSHRRFSALADKRGTGWTHYLLARLETIADRYDQALEYAQQSLTLFIEVGDHNGVGNAWMAFASVEHEQGNLDRARQFIEKAQGEFSKAESSFGTSRAMYELGLVVYRQGDASWAQKLLTESLEIREAIGDLGGIAECLDTFAFFAADQGKDERAARLLGAAQTVRDSFGEVPSPQRRRDRARVLACVQNALGRGAFERFYALGATTPTAEAVDFALEQVSTNALAMVR